MSALFLLIVISLIVATGFLAAFIWSVRKGQYEDDYTPSVRMLFDDEIPAENTSTPNSNSKANSTPNSNSKP
jgi:cbb3-type cytochrome oxidase maturation protein